MMAADDPVSCAIYAKEKGLLDRPGWKQFKKIAKRRTRNNVNFLLGLGFKIRIADIRTPWLKTVKFSQEQNKSKTLEGHNSRVDAINGSIS